MIADDKPISRCGDKLVNDEVVNALMKKLVSILAQGLYALPSTDMICYPSLKELPTIESIPVGEQQVEDQGFSTTE